MYKKLNETKRKRLDEEAIERLLRMVKSKNKIESNFNRPLNELVFEFTMTSGPDLLVNNWPGYHSTGIALETDKKESNITREKIINILESSFNCTAKLIASSITDPQHGPARNYWYSLGNEFFVIIYSRRLWVYNSNLDIIIKIEELLKEFSIKSDKQIFLLTSGIDGVNLTPSKYINQPLVYENYTEQVSKSLKKALEWSQEKKPKGRILIMSGPPGTGKSYAIRGLISESAGVDWALIPSYLVPELSSPNIIASLITDRSDPDRPLNLIIEDADSLLKKREENSPDIISQVLNLGDGILGEMVNVKLIMTTNCPRVNMDEAIIRRGRLNAFIDFGTLPPEQATNIYKKLSNKDVIYTKNMILCDIYADAYEQEENNIPKKEMLGNYL